MTNKLKREIQNLYYSYDSTNVLFEKGYLWSIFSYLSDLFPNDLDIQKMFCDIAKKAIKIEKLISVEDKKMNREIKYFMKDNKHFFRDIIPDIKGYYKGDINTFSDENNEYLTMILESFLQSVSMSFFRFYKKIVNEERIIKADDNQVAFSSLYSADTFVFIENFKSIFDVMVLVHELAHSYYYFLNNEILNERQNIENNIKEEIPSRMIELMFINYIKKMNLNDTYLKLKKEYENELYYYNENRSEIKNIKYLIGSYMAYQLYNKYSIEDYFYHVYESNYQDLLLEAKNNNIKGKVLIK